MQKALRKIFIWSKMNTHEKARGIGVAVPYRYATFDLKTVQRFKVPDDQVSWSSKKNSDWYHPVEFTAPKLKAMPAWADPMDPKEVRPAFNTGPRTTYTKNDQGQNLYTVDPETNRPVNPIGRTGVSQRGSLGKWGPNHAADPLVMRRKPADPSVLQFVAIVRKDTGEFAIPGGMVEYGDSVSLTLKKEFLEETQNILEKSEEEARQLEDNLEKIFVDPILIYQGYVDDPRNTDNAWMETSCMLFFDASGELTKNLTLEAGDDAGHALWADIPEDFGSFKLYASHAKFVELAVAEVRKRF